MRLSIISITILVAFLMNGCLVNRIKQRIMAQNMQKQAEQNGTVAVVNDFNETKLYQPSSANPALYEDVKKNKKRKTTKKKKKYTKKKKRVKTTKKKKKYTKSKKVKKIAPEPYSIEKNEEDPELLGPQTTLKSNPLSKNSKEAKKEESKKI